MKQRSVFYRRRSYNSKHKELFEKKFDSDEDGAKTIERTYDSDGDFIYAKTESEIKDNTTDIIKTKPSAKAKTKREDVIFTGTKYECKECNEEFRNKIALTTHSNSHSCRYIENREHFDIKSSQNMREF